MLEFPHDDTGGDQEDALFEMSFFVPKENDRYAVTEGDAMQEVSLHCEVPALTGGVLQWLTSHRAVFCTCKEWGHLPWSVLQGLWCREY